MKTRFNHLNIARTVTGNPRLTQKEVKLQDSELLHRVAISGAGGTYELLTDNTLRETGISTFSGKEIPSGELHIVEGVYVAYAEEATGTALKKLNKYVYENQRKGAEEAAKVHVFPAELLSATLHLYQDNKLLFSLPVARLAAAGRESRIDKDAFHLQHPLVVKSKFPVDIKLEFGNGAAMTTDKQHLFEVRLLSKKITNR